MGKWECVKLTSVHQVLRFGNARDSSMALTRLLTPVTNIWKCLFFPPILGRWLGHTWMRFMFQWLFSWGVLLPGGSQDRYNSRGKPVLVTWGYAASGPAVEWDIAANTGTTEGKPQTLSVKSHPFLVNPGIGIGGRGKTPRSSGRKQQLEGWNNGTETLITARCFRGRLWSWNLTRLEELDNHLTLSP